MLQTEKQHHYTTPGKCKKNRRNQRDNQFPNKSIDLINDHVITVKQLLA